jgi:hypothetical protein
MIGKYPRYDMIGAINLYCSKNGLHVKYIEKLRKSQLEAIIIQYNINVDEMLFELAKERELGSIAMQESQAKLDKAVNNIKGKMDMLISLLNDEQKEKYFEYCNAQNSNL